MLKLTRIAYDDGAAGTGEQGHGRRDVALARFVENHEIEERGPKWDGRTRGQTRHRPQWLKAEERGNARWRHVGRYEVERSSIDAHDIREHCGGRTDVTRVIWMRRID